MDLRRLLLIPAVAALCLAGIPGTGRLGPVAAQTAPSAEEMAAALEIAAARPAPPKRWARTEPLDTRAFRPAPPPAESEAATLPALKLSPILAPRPPQAAHIGAGARTALLVAALLFVALAALLLYSCGQGVTM